MIQGTVAHQSTLSMGFPKQEYWNELSFPPPGDLPNPEIEPMCPVLVGGFFTTDPPGKSSKVDTNSFNSFLHVVYSSSYGITGFFWYLVI